jgi:hypothetical protein
VSGVRLAGERWPVHIDTLPRRRWRDRTPPPAPVPDWRGYPVMPPEPDAGPSVLVEVERIVKEGTFTIGYGLARDALGHRERVRFIAGQASYDERGMRATVPPDAILEPERLPPDELLADLARGPDLGQ